MDDHPEYAGGATPPRPTLDKYLAQVRHHRLHQNLPYPTADDLLSNLPMMLRAVADYALSGEATTEEIAYSIASLIDAIEHRTVEPPVRPQDACLH